MHSFVGVMEFLKPAELTVFGSPKCSARVDRKSEFASATAADSSLKCNSIMTRV